jgi:hypothetical protein
MIVGHWWQGRRVYKKYIRPASARCEIESAFERAIQCGAAIIDHGRRLGGAREGNTDTSTSFAYLAVSSKFTNKNAISTRAPNEDDILTARHVKCRVVIYNTYGDNTNNEVSHSIMEVLRSNPNHIIQSMIHRRVIEALGRPFVIVVD